VAAPSAANSRTIRSLTVVAVPLRSERRADWYEHCFASVDHFRNVTAGLCPLDNQSSAEEVVHVGLVSIGANQRTKTKRSGF
jgi:hypothetical protein